MITDDLKTLIDAQWSDPSSVTQSCYVYIENDPDVSEVPQTTATKVINVILKATGIPTRKGHGCDKWTYDGTLITYSKTTANIKVAFAELKRISHLAATPGTLYFLEPNIGGDSREANYVISISFTWIKTIAH